MEHSAPTKLTLVTGQNSTNESFSLYWNNYLQREK